MFLFTFATIFRIVFSPCEMNLDQRSTGDPQFFHNYTGYTSMLLGLRFILHIFDIRYSSIIFPNTKLQKILLESRIGCEELKKVGVPQSDGFLVASADVNSMCGVN